MKFLYPGFLFALFAILIPILIHLFSFRRFKTVYFSNVDYLLQIKNEAEKKSRLKNLLILIARILAITAMVFGFSQPFIPSRSQARFQPDPVVGVYIDNSFSMNALSPKGQLLEVARNKALEISDAYPPGTRFRIITNDLLAQHQHIFNKEQFLQQVSEIKISSRTLPLSVVHNRMATGLREGESFPNTTLYFLSDFQSGICDFQNFRTDSNLVSFLMPLTGGITKNLTIDSCWMELPAHKIDQEEIVKVRISNYSDQSYQNLPLKFYLDDSLKALANFNIEAGASETVELNYLNLKGGFHTGHAEISDYPFTHDNTYYLSYKVRQYLKVLAISGTRHSGGSGLPYLRAMFRDDRFIQFEESLAENLQISKISDFNTILLVNLRELGSGLVNELMKAASNGATVVFFPELDGKTDSYNHFLLQMKANRIVRSDTAAKQLAGIEWEHPVFDNVFKNKAVNPAFPTIYGSTIFLEETRIPEVRLLWFRDNTKAASIQQTGKGNLVVFSFPLSPRNDDFANDMLFVPVLYGVVINCLELQKVAYTIGREPSAYLGRQVMPDLTRLLVRREGSGQEFIPEVVVSEENQVRITFTGHFDVAGHYKVFYQDSIAGILSMNYDREESQLGGLSAEEIRVSAGNNNLVNCHVIENPEVSFSETLSGVQTGKRLWKWFLGFALMFLLAEAILVRFWK